MNILMTNKKFSIIPVQLRTGSIYPVKYFHGTHFLLMDNTNPQANPNKIPEVDATKMLQGLEEIVKNSESKTVSDLISEDTSSFEEAFPNFYKDSKMSKFFGEKKLSDIINQALSKNDNDDEFLSKFKDSISEVPGDTPLQKLINFSILEKNKKDGSWEGLANDLKDKINFGYNAPMSDAIQTKSVTPGKLIDITEDKKLVLDLDKLSDLIQRTSEQLPEVVGVYGPYSFFGFTSLMFWKGLVKGYDSGNKFNLDNFKKDSSKLQAMRIMTHGRLAFTTAGTLVLMFGIYNCFNIIPKKYNVNIDIANNADQNNSHKSVLFLLSLIKNWSIWKKGLLFLVLVVLIYFNFNTILSIKLFIDKNIIYFKLFNFIALSLILLYFVFFFVVLDRFKKSNIEPILPKYIPSFFKEEISAIYAISKMLSTDREMVVEHMKRTMFMVTIIYFAFIVICIVS